MYTFMMRWDEMRDAVQKTGADWPMPNSIQKTNDRFMEVARKKNVTRLNEWNVGFDNLEKALERAQK